MKRKIAAIVAADIAGYSTLVADDEEETLRRLASYRAVIDDFIAKSSGRIFNTAVMLFWPSLRVRWRQSAAPSISRRVFAPATLLIHEAGR